MNNKNEKCIVNMCGEVRFLFSSSSPPVVVVVPVGISFPFGRSVGFRVACPRGRHARRRRVGAIVHETKVLLFRYSLVQLAKYVIVYVSSIATALEKVPGVGKTTGTVFAGNKVGTNRQ